MCRLINIPLGIKRILVLLLVCPLFTAVSGGAVELVGSSACPDEHPAIKAFDGSATGSDFWECSLDGPITITWQPDRGEPLSSYALFSGDSEPGRMPITWTLEGKDDTGHWIVVDKRERQRPWKTLENRKFEIDPPASYSLFRLTFSPGSVPGSNILRIFEITPNADSQSTAGFPVTERFIVHPHGMLEWPGALRISKSGEKGGLPPFEDGRTRARPGGTLVIQPQGDLMRGAIDLLPTSGKTPDTGAHGEITLHRRIPDADGYDMVSFAALAREDLPFGILLERHGDGRPRPFVFMSMLENKEFTQAHYYEPLRITEEGTVRIGRKRGKGSTAKLENNDPTQVDALFLEREDPPTPGQFSSDFFRITAKSRRNGVVYRHDWRVNVQLDENGGASLMMGLSSEDSQTNPQVAFHDDGTLELLTPGAGIMMQSRTGKRWLLSVDDEGQIKTMKVP